MAIVNMQPIYSGVDLPADVFPAYIKFSKEGTSAARNIVHNSDGTYTFCIEVRGTIEFIPIKNFTIKYLGYNNTYDCEVGHVYKFHRTYNSGNKTYFYVDGSQVTYLYGSSNIAFTYSID